MTKIIYTTRNVKFIVVQVVLLSTCYVIQNILNIAGIFMRKHTNVQRRTMWIRGTHLRQIQVNVIYSLSIVLIPSFQIEAPDNAKWVAQKQTPL